MSVLALAEYSFAQPAKNTRARVSLHLFTTVLRSDSRFTKEAHSLLRTGLAEEVVLLGPANGAGPLAERVGERIGLLRFPRTLTGLPRFKLFGCLKYAETIWREVTLAKQIHASVIHCHSVSSLPAAVLASARLRVPLVYDARELETERNGLSGINQSFVRRLERALIKKCDAVLCVSDSIADWYARAYRISRPFVVRNIPDVRGHPPANKSAKLHDLFGIPDEHIIFVYSGMLARGRLVERALQVFRQVSQDRHLVFMGFGPLEGIVKEAAAVQSNIHFLPAVPPAQVLDYTAGGDVGFAAHLEPGCLNHRYALPNKFFEYVLAGVPVWVNDVHEEMAALVRRHGFGWVTPYAKQGMADWVNGLTLTEIENKRALTASARQHYSWEREEETLVQAYKEAEMKARRRFRSL
jgi:glycosyltransferase involved in cell wall biosynthesis